MTVQHDKGEHKGVFYIEVGETREAHMTYSWAGTDKIIIDHTEVNDSLRGKGAGKKLVAVSVEFARKRRRNSRIAPASMSRKGVRGTVRIQA